MHLKRCECIKLTDFPMGLQEYSFLASSSRHFLSLSG